eukprot:6227944-Amphidinium_carterae.2
MISLACKIFSVVVWQSGQYRCGSVVSSSACKAVDAKASVPPQRETASQDGKDDAHGDLWFPISSQASSISSLSARNSCVRKATVYGVACTAAHAYVVQGCTHSRLSWTMEVHGHTHTPATRDPYASC